MSKAKNLAPAAALQQAAARILEVIQKANPETLADAAVKDAGAYTKFTEALLRLNKGILEVRILEEELRARRLQNRAGLLPQANRLPREAGLSIEALDEIGELLGLKKSAPALMSAEND